MRAGDAFDAHVTKSRTTSRRALHAGQTRFQVRRAPWLRFGKGLLLPFPSFLPLTAAPAHLDAPGEGGP